MVTEFSAFESGMQEKRTETRTRSRTPYDAAKIAGALGFETRSQPSSLAPTLVTLPSMSRVPRAPFTKTESSASLNRLAKSLAASRHKVRACEPLDITLRSERQEASDAISQAPFLRGSGGNGCAVLHSDLR